MFVSALMQGYSERSKTVLWWKTRKVNINSYICQQALHPGQIQNSWCRVCHQKMKIAADGVRFTQLEPSATQGLFTAYNCKELFSLIDIYILI